MRAFCGVWAIVSDLMSSKPRCNFADMFPGMFIDEAALPSCGPGWDGIITDMCRKLRGLNERVVLSCVKQKLGTLRVYIEVGNSMRSHALIDEAEKASHSTCEECGAAATLKNDNGQLSTMCDACYEIKKLRMQNWVIL